MNDYNVPDDYMAGVTKLSMEIITGNIPDILDITFLPVEQYVAMGLLEDLYPFIDDDPELNREDFVENLFSRAEIEGGLYYVFPLYTLSTIAGNPNVLGSQPGWTVDEFIDVLAKNPNADIPMGAWFPNEHFLHYAVRLNMDRFIDRVAGTADFDNEDFIEILKAASFFPSDVLSYYDINYRDDLASGRQIMKHYWFQGFTDYQKERELFGGELVFKGFPGLTGIGSFIDPYPTFAITTVSENKDGAWSFIRSFMTDHWQQNAFDQGPHRIPTNKAVFDHMIEKAMNQPEQTITIREVLGGEITSIDLALKPIPQAEMDRFLELNSTAVVMRSNDYLFTSIMNIVNETASGYFSGQITAKDAARIIQSRASILASEQFG